MQRVVVHLVRSNVMPHVTPSPIDQRVELNDGHTVGHVGFLCRHFGTRLRLFASETSDPSFLVFQCPTEGFQFAYAATGFALGHAFINSLLSRLFHKCDDGFVLRAVHLHRCARMGLQSF